MPRFYFEMENEGQLSEEDVFDLADSNAAKLEAVRYLTESSVYNLTHGIPSVCTVRDDRKRAVLRVRLTLTIDEIS